jgi:hypothetical protein
LISRKLLWSPEYFGIYGLAAARSGTFWKYVLRFIGLVTGRGFTYAAGSMGIYNKYWNNKNKRRYMENSARKLSGDHQLTPWPEAYKNV